MKTSTHKPTTGRNFMKISLSMRKEMFEAMKLVVEKRGLSSTSELVRSIFQNYYENDFRKTYFGYQSGINPARKKENKQKTALCIEDLEKKTDKELTQWLIDVGYSDPNTFLDNTQTVEKRFYVKTSPLNGKREYHSSNIALATGEDQYHAIIFGWEELIAELKKHKKI